MALRVNDLATTDPLLVTEWHDYLNGSKRPELMFAGTDRYWWKCAFGHVQQQSVPNRRKSRGCTECKPEDRILNQN
ncbi:zinc-ribbon domain-containing protein [Curtobacterium pusillum]|uniref:zinc-ribbon domain-containing protein n=1 Tax=Curtobacterium pusillum TaxID=69373 RepID=UPI001C300FB6